MKTEEDVTTMNMIIIMLLVAVLVLGALIIGGLIGYNIKAETIVTATPDIFSTLPYSTWTPAP